MRKDGKEIDRREEEIGFRYFHADAEKGFFLNGKPYRLNGVNRHQDRAERASAFYPQDHDGLDAGNGMQCRASLPLSASQIHASTDGQAGTGGMG